MKLCLVSSINEDGNDIGLFIVAHNKVEAVKIWNEYCAENDWLRGGDDYGDGAQIYEPDHVRQILEDITDTEYDRGDDIARAIDWVEVRTME
jgi:hypothetical protein